MHPARSLLALSFLLFACSKDKDPTLPTTTLSASDGDGDGDSTGASGTQASEPTTGGPDTATDTGTPDVSNRDLDILFVIDNSGSMADKQRRLVAAFPTLAAILEDPDDPFNYRIGFTTTDTGNPRCFTTSPENGNLVLSSCLDRIADGQFVTQDTDYSSACTDVCDLTDDQIKIAASATDYETEKSPRRWLERIDGASNIDIDLADAFACFAPQGVAGCGFESHLDAMNRAVALSKQKSNDRNYGFLRDAASLLVVIVSDETDCSAVHNYDQIFTTNKVFWNDPDNDVAPTSAMCWAAGVACAGASPYSDCHSENYDVEGKAGAADEAAVLVPVHMYTDDFKQLADQKHTYSTGAEVIVALITAVPPGYETRDAELAYEDSPDLDYQSLFGIGPGCIDIDTTAVPPVREREFAEAFNADPTGDRLLYSVCADDYSSALAHLGARLRD